MKTWKAEVESSSQLGSKYQFYPDDFKEDGYARLELAYDLTIHKAQGSEFGVTFVIVPSPCQLLTRELLYAALIRQQHAVVILHQGDVRSLMNLTSDRPCSTGAEQLDPDQATPAGRKTRFRRSDSLVVEYVENEGSSP